MPPVKRTKPPPGEPPAPAAKPPTFPITVGTLVTYKSGTKPWRVTSIVQTKFGLLAGLVSADDIQAAYLNDLNRYHGTQDVSPLK